MPPNGAVAPLEGGCSAGFGQQLGLAHQALGPSGTYFGGRRGRFALLKARCWRVAPLEITCEPRLGPEIGVCRLSNRSWAILAWNRTPPWHEATPSCRPRGSRWHFQGRWGTLEPRKSWGTTAAGRLNATQPGVIAVSNPYIRGLEVPCKGSVAGRQHLALFTHRQLVDR